MVRFYNLSTNTTRTNLSVLTLEDRATPATLEGAGPEPLSLASRFAVASNVGETSAVNVYESQTNALLTTITPFGREFTQGVNVAVGDVTGDGIDDLVIAAAAGRARVQVYDGNGFVKISEFDAFSATSPGGAFVAIGDITGDGRADLVLGAGQGNRSQVKIVRGQDLASPAPKFSANFFAFNMDYTGGVRVAVGDVNGDGIGDLVTAPGVGDTANVKLFTTSGKWGDAPFTRWNASRVSEFGVGRSSSREQSGVFVALGDYNGDGKADLAVSRETGGRAVVTIYNAGNPRQILTTIDGISSGRQVGLPVTLRDLNRDGQAELIVSSNEPGTPVKVVSQNTSANRLFMAFAPTEQSGIFVG